MIEQLKQKSIFTYKPGEALSDPVNVRILEALVQEPRLPMTELSRRVGLSSPAVTERVRRLEETGVIKSYRLEIDPKALGLPVAAFIRIRPNAGQLFKIAELAQSIPEVTECHRVTGEDCFILKVCLPGLDQLDSILDLFLAFGNTNTSLIQSSPVPPRTPPLPEI
jgi:Lrp/AsnC family leucine-responsive transcriptional regulator